EKPGCSESLLVGRYQHIPSTFHKSIINASPYGIAGLPVGQHAGHSISYLRLCFVWPKLYQASLPRFPGIVHWTKGRVLAQHQSRQSLPENAASNESLGGLKSGDSSAPTSNRLKVILRQLTHSFHCVQQRRSQSISPCNVLYAALPKKPFYPRNTIGYC